MSTTNNPQSVKIARKRGAEEPPNTLIVQSGEGAADGSPAYYVRKRRVISTKSSYDVDKKQEIAFAPQQGPKNELARRLFRLKQASLPASSGGGKRRRDNVATFVEERKEKSPRSGSPGAKIVDGQDVPQYAAQERPLKRPSRQPRARKEELVGLGGENEREQTEAEKREMESLAQYLHEAALEEVGREKQQSMAKVTPPKISGQKAREMHRRRVESNRKLASQTQQTDGADGGMDMSDGDYIYDTYVLAPNPTASLTDLNSIPAPFTEDIGYLVISPEEQETWETYIDLQGSDSEADQTNTDDEDENAEDYYGADYPEDELSEDDEFDRQAYGYRRGADESDGDGYESDDADEAAWSDGEQDVEAMMNPFKYRGPRLGGVRRRLEGVEG